MKQSKNACNRLHVFRKATLFLFHSTSINITQQVYNFDMFCAYTEASFVFFLFVFCSDSAAPWTNCITDKLLKLQKQKKGQYSSNILE